MRDLGEASYLIEKLYNMTVYQSYVAAQKEAALQELQATTVQVNNNYTKLFSSLFSDLFYPILKCNISGK